jgi:hypothetical protein
MKNKRKRCMEILYMVKGLLKMIILLKRIKNIKIWEVIILIQAKIQ